MDIVAFTKSLLDFASAFGWVGVVVAPFVGWVWINYRVFYPKPGASEEAEKHRANDLEHRRRWIQASHFEQRYLGLLGGMRYAFPLYGAWE